MKQLTAILIGAGARGRRYTDIMAKTPEKFKVVGVAEPIVERREYAKEKHSIENDNCYDCWTKILARPKFADFAVISTMDRMHYEPAMKALELGYDLLLEKPVTPSAEECANIYKKANELGRKVLVCHVLRYTDFFRSIKRFIEDGVLGDIMSVEHTEAVGNVHQSHSFVRGLWGKESDGCFMLLAKCCHDLDILQWLLNKECNKVQSFGSRTHFRIENAPEDAPERCTDGCPHADTCYYNAIKLYYDDKDNDWFRPACTQIPHPTDEDVMRALKTTQYGKCVYKCDNDVVDHQTVNMEFEGGTTVTLTMAAFNKGGRNIRIMGTKGELWGDIDAPGEKAFRFYDFATREERYLESHLSKTGNSINDGHAGGDDGIVESLYDYLCGNIGSENLSEIGISCKNHLIAFAAEEARLSDTVVNMDKYYEKYLG